MLHMALVFLVIGLIAALARFHDDCRRVDRDRQVPGGLVPVLFLVFLIIGMAAATAHHRLTASSLIQWRISGFRDPPLNARPHRHFSVAATRRVL